MKGRALAATWNSQAPTVIRNRGQSNSPAEPVLVGRAAEHRMRAALSGPTGMTLDGLSWSCHSPRERNDDVHPADQLSGPGLRGMEESL